MDFSKQIFMSAQKIKLILRNFFFEGEENAADDIMIMRLHKKIYRDSW
jgi:hypothetical protein